MTRLVEGFCDKIVSFNNPAEVVLHAVVKPALVHWSLLTSLTTGQLPYAAAD